MICLDRRNRHGAYVCGADMRECNTGRVMACITKDAIKIIVSKVPVFNRGNKAGKGRK